MKKNTCTLKTTAAIERAVSGNEEAMESLLSGVQDMIFNLSLRMLGTIPDAEDATQEILIRIITKLSTFRKESEFTTWVYRLSVNYLMNYKKTMFVSQPFDLEMYGNDIRYAKTEETDHVIDGLYREALADELKMSCTNVMLQCLDAENRCIFILGTMFHLDSHSAADILQITPEAYRKRLSRIRKKMADFLSEYCGLTGTGLCSCYHRVSYAVSQGRIQLENPEYTKLPLLPKEKLRSWKEDMERLDALACTFEDFPNYQSAVTAKTVIHEILHSEAWKHIQKF